MANTTNLNLVKPAGTDKALVSVLNSNSDKIDAWAGTTDQAIATLNRKTTLSIDYVSNAYCSQEAVARMHAYKEGNVFFLNGNLACRTNADPMADLMQVAKINGWNAIDITYVQVVAQNDASKTILVEVDPDGKILIYAANGTIGSFYRFNVCIPSA